MVKRTYIHRERPEQVSFVMWFRWQYPQYSNLMIHVPNGGSRNQVEALHFKRMGVLSGFPDIGIFVPSGDYHGLFIEMKAHDPNCKKPRVSARQKEVMCDLINKGYRVAVACGCDEAREITIDYLKVGDPKK